jgi:hypothetical protein
MPFQMIYRPGTDFRAEEKEGKTCDERQRTCGSIPSHTRSTALGTCRFLSGAYFRLRHLRRRGRLRPSGPPWRRDGGNMWEGPSALFPSSSRHQHLLPGGRFCVFREQTAGALECVADRRISETVPCDGRLVREMPTTTPFPGPERLSTTKHAPHEPQRSHRTNSQFSASKLLRASFYRFIFH